MEQLFSKEDTQNIGIKSLESARVELLNDKSNLKYVLECLEDQKKYTYETLNRAEPICSTI